MTQPEYEQKKRECWEEFCRANPSHNKSIFARKVFAFAFDRAYALGKQEKDAEENVISGWVARDSNGPNDLGLRVYSVKPKRMEGLKRWNGHGEKSTLIDCRLFPNLTWESAPEPVEIIIRKKK